MRSAGEVLGAMVAAFDTGRVDDVAAFVDDTYIDHQGLHGEEVGGTAGFVRVVNAARGSYDALAVSMEDLIEDGDRAVARLRWTGTRPTGEVAVRETIEIVHVREGRAVEHWGGRS
jgi:predicted SnoaL-like aldol condensation-catalyzing enzyme